MRLRLFYGRCDKEEPGLPVVAIDKQSGVADLLTPKTGPGVSESGRRLSRRLLL
jgi:hypothetical protein